MDHRDDHEQPRAARYAPAHPVTLAADGLLARLAGRSEVRVNSLHGQGIARLGEGLVVEATAPDGLIEAARLPDRRFVVGVQWHPEWQFAENPLSRALFAAFGAAARQWQD
jgi:putative glutamine amidotransferase